MVVFWGRGVHLILFFVVFSCILSQTCWTLMALLRSIIPVSIKKKKKKKKKKEKKRKEKKKESEKLTTKRRKKKEGERNNEEKK